VVRVRAAVRAFAGVRCIKESLSGRVGVREAGNATPVPKSVSTEGQGQRAASATGIPAVAGSAEGAGRG
jgi:hypothetical protein